MFGGRRGSSPFYIPRGGRARPRSHTQVRNPMGTGPAAGATARAAPEPRSKRCGSQRFDRPGCVSDCPKETRRAGAGKRLVLLVQPGPGCGLGVEAGWLLASLADGRLRRAVGRGMGECSSFLRRPMPTRGRVRVPRISGCESRAKEVRVWYFLFIVYFHTSLR